LADAKNPKPGQIVGAGCKAHRKDMQYPIEEIVLLEEVDKGQGQLWQPLQKKHGLEMTAERRALRTAFPPPVGLPTMNAAMAAEIEARVLAMEISGDDAEIGAPDSAPRDPNPFSAQELAAWCRAEGFSADEAKAAKVALDLGGIKTTDLTSDQRRAVRDRLAASRTVAPSAPYADAVEGQFEGGDSEPALASDLPDEADMQKEFLGLAVRVGGMEPADARKTWAALEGPDQQWAAVQGMRAKQIATGQEGMTFDE